MKPTGQTFRNVLLAGLLAGAIWSVMLWPLPRHVASAIPTAAIVGSSEPIKHMTAGDHLQLLYHFWLFEDMVDGGTPWFHNLYEFNLGDDSARRETGAYYFPFSFFFAVGDWIGGRAFGWNFSTFASAWLGLGLTFALLRRYGTPAGWAWALAALASAFPYRWFNLAGGSPSGFAMCWPPLLAYGLDIAVREKRPYGGALAGLALLLSAWDDTHVYFFSILLTPVWCVLALLWTTNRPAFRDVPRWTLALSPVPLAVLVAVITTRNMTGNVKSAGLGGRTPQEVLLSSPAAPGLFAREELGITNHVFLGFGLLILLGLGGTAALLLVWKRRDRWRGAVSICLLGALTLGIVALSLGFRGWHDGLFIRIARKLIPPYAMIRQPAKIFTILPTVLAVAAALGLQSLLETVRRPRLVAALGAVLVAASFAEYTSLLGVRAGRVDRSQQAYAAVCTDARGRNETPRAIVLPLWPGDSHHTSIYQFFASQNRLRMVNGYRPFVPKTYREDFFNRFASFNQGALPDAQLDELAAMGVRYLLLHEDLFPEKVSPFPVGLTLKRLLNHPRLAFIGQDGPVHAWRILDAPATRPAVGTTWTNWAPAQRWLLAREILRRGASASNDNADATFACMPAGSIIQPRRKPQPVFSEALRLMTRVRGTGSFVLPDGSNTVPFASQDWTWIDWPIEGGSELPQVKWRLKEGSVDAQFAALTTGRPPSPGKGDAVVWPAPTLFHAGATDRAHDTVVLDPARDNDGITLYGGRIPLEPGPYALEVAFTADDAEKPLGTWHIECPEGRLLARVDMKAGTPFSQTFTVPDNQLLQFVFVWNGETRVAFSSVTLKRLP